MAQSQQSGTTAFETAVSLTKKMDEMLYARDLVGVKQMYHPEVESTKPHGDVVKGVDANFAGFEMIVNMFPDMEYTSSNFRPAPCAGAVDAADGHGDLGDTGVGCGEEVSPVARSRRGGWGRRILEAGGGRGTCRDQSGGEDQRAH